MGVIVAEYVWVDGDGGLRSKSKVIRDLKKVKSPEDLPDWNFDGSSTGQAEGSNSEIELRPEAVFRDPFRREEDVLVMCSTWTPDGEPTNTNHRAKAAEMFAQRPGDKPWFGLEQEYTLFQDGAPLGWPQSKARSVGGPLSTIGFPGDQGPYYCSAGADVAFGREISEEHLFKCIDAGLLIGGTNAEVMPGQWEYQIGPCTGVEIGDHFCMSRYILHRVCEKYEVIASFDPKPIPGKWNGVGCHVNFSTKPMRENDDAWETIFKPGLEKLRERHEEHIKVYGKGNERRLTGKSETASIDDFSYGVGDRSASIRISSGTDKKGKGYIEDRRPAGNIDPYLVCGKIYETMILATQSK